MSERARFNRELKARRRIVVAAFFAFAGVLVWRAVVLQMHDSDFLQTHGDARYLRVEQIHADRGMVLDRNGEPLAISTPTQSAWIKPGEFVREREHWGELGEILGVSVEQIDTLVMPRLGRKFVYLRRHLAPDEGAAIEKLDLDGLWLQQEYRRYYPVAEVTAHVVGFTNVDDRGQEGVELAFDEMLKGEPGLRRVIKDRLGRVVEDVERLHPLRPGKDVYLSIDERIQYVAYRALKNAVHAHHARAGIMVIVDPRSGEIVALVNQPSFNPNNRADLKVEHYRDRAVTDLFEPGSTIKPFTIATALESGQYQPDTVIDTAPGYFKVGRDTVRDVRNYGTLDVAGVIEKSSNVGSSKIALSMEPELLWNSLRSFGFGSLTDAALPGETYGRLNDYANWSQIEHATLAFGYGLSVTAVQLARAYTVLANGGWMQPLSIVRRDGPPPRTRVIKTSTARTVRRMMEKVITVGTGQRAAVPGYTVAGKTGTVHKSIDSGYAEHRYLSLFAGIIPARKPRLVAVVVIDEPDSGEHFGGQVAAPIFAEVMREATRILNIAPDADTREQAQAVWLAGLHPATGAPTEAAQ
ncbi:MAG: penicillin-binding protein 2 [Gammaproteobacteria bacterium]|nr:penicillin-binding protein 2 [Gammaproteobacteria bacterium]MCP5199394.1 penicillin-binding protein 2 [Gammaproteobacteria bacterium]